MWCRGIFKPKPFMTSKGSQVHHLSLNQDFSCFSVGLSNGFRIFNMNPLKEKRRKEFSDGGLSIVEMLYRSNFLVLVGGGKYPKYPSNKVIVWDDQKEKCVIELEFRSEVKKVCITRDKVIVALLSKIFVYSLCSNPTKLCSFDTFDNDYGALSVCHSLDYSVLAFPGRQQGHVQLVDMETFPSGNETFLSPEKESTPVTQRKPLNVSIISAHSSTVTLLSFNNKGNLLASTSSRGTLVRVFNTFTGQLLHEFRRGADAALIWCMNFNLDSSRLCVCSDKGTVHVFTIQQSPEKRSPESTTPTMADRNRVSSLNFMKDLLPKYFSSEWSFAYFRVPCEMRCLCTFGELTPEGKEMVNVISEDGSFYSFSYNQSIGGEGKLERYDRYIGEED